MSAKNMLSELAAMRRQAVQDNPHQSKNPTEPQSLSAENAASEDRATQTVSADQPRPRQGGRKEKKASPPTQSERTTLIFTPSALSALGKLQAFFLSECGIRSANASMAANIALEFAAEHLTTDQRRLKELYAARLQADGRRKAV